MSKYYLSVCAIVRDEAPYLAEWIEFHKLQGVEHFYIYHNRGGKEDQATEDALKPYGPDIHYYNWYGTAAQCKAYDHCLKGSGRDSEWIAFIDADEFLWSPSFILGGPPSTVATNLKNLNPEKLAGVAAHWMLFGSNGHKEKTDGLVIERFTRRARSVNCHVKSIVRPEHTESAGRDPHSFLPKKGYRVINERGMVLPRHYSRCATGSADIFRVNHYFTKSHGEFLSRKLGKPRADIGGFVPKERVEEMLAAHDCNEVEDTTVRDLYAEKIKELMRAHG